jgi:xylose isomerase
VFDGVQGSAFEQGKLSLSDLFDVATSKTDVIKPRSGKQEYLENILNNHI